jgi:hypothetical protein
MSPIPIHYQPSSLKPTRNPEEPFFRMAHKQLGQERGIRGIILCSTRTKSLSEAMEHGRVHRHHYDARAALQHVHDGAIGSFQYDRDRPSAMLLAQAVQPRPKGLRLCAHPFDRFVVPAGLAKTTNVFVGGPVQTYDKTISIQVHDVILDCGTSGP